MAALSVFRSQSFFCQGFFQRKKRISAQAGLQIQRQIGEDYNQDVCHSVGNLTKWFDEVNLSKLCRDSYGMTNESLKIK